MNRKLMLTLAAVLSLSLVGLIPAISQEKAAPDPAPEEKEAPAAPDGKSDQHKALARLAGEFDTVIKLWAEPGKDPTEVKSKSKREMLFGGYFLRETYELGGDYAHNGEITWGYNPRTKKVTFCHVTSVNPEMVVRETEWDGKSKTVEIKFSSSMVWDGQTVDFTSRYVYTFESDDKQKLEMFTLYPGMKVPGTDKDMGEMKELEVIYTRQKNG